MRPKALFGVVLASILGASAWARTGDPQVEALLAKMRNAYKQTREVTFTTRALAGGRDFETSGAYMSPNKMRVTVTMTAFKKIGAVLTRICDGKTVSTKELSNPFKDQPFTVDNMGADLPVNLESMCFFDWARQLSTAPGKNMEHSTFRILPHQTWNGKDWTVLEETAAKEKVVCNYYIDPKTDIIWRTTVKAMPGGNKASEMDCRITELNLSAKIDPTTFQIVQL